MFESGLPPDLNADLRAAAPDPRLWRACAPRPTPWWAMLPAAKRPARLMMKHCKFWSNGATGIALAVSAAAMPGRRTLPMTAEEAARNRFMLIYLQGLGFSPKRS